ncbi:uncharacterized protein VSU04_015598 [Chlamydotis macqueenii]
MRHEMGRVSVIPPCAYGRDGLGCTGTSREGALGDPPPALRAGGPFAPHSACTGASVAPPHNDQLHLLASAGAADPAAPGGTRPQSQPSRGRCDLPQIAAAHRAGEDGLSVMSLPPSRAPGKANAARASRRPLARSGERGWQRRRSRVRRAGRVASDCRCICSSARHRGLLAGASGPPPTAQCLSFPTWMRLGEDDAKTRRKGAAQSPPCSAERLGRPAPRLAGRTPGESQICAPHPAFGAQLDTPILSQCPQSSPAPARQPPCPSQAALGRWRTRQMPAPIREVSGISG